MSSTFTADSLEYHISRTATKVSSVNISNIICVEESASSGESTSHALASIQYKVISLNRQEDNKFLERYGVEYASIQHLRTFLAWKHVLTSPSCAKYRHFWCGGAEVITQETLPKLWMYTSATYIIARNIPGAWRSTYVQQPRHRSCEHTFEDFLVERCPFFKTKTKESVSWFVSLEVQTYKICDDRMIMSCTRVMFLR